MKTIQEWLNALPNPYRIQALNNMEFELANKEMEGIRAALAYAFFWSHTPEGFLFWQNVYWEQIK